MKSKTLTEVEAAQYLSVSRSSLRQARINGRRRNRMPPPPYVRLGRAIRYLVDDLDTWLARNRVANDKKEGA